MLFSLVYFFSIWYVYFLLLILCFLLIVAYFTLLERKIMASMQRRNGPDYVGFWGLLQPISDALKLLFKEFLVPQVSYSFIFILSPVFIFFFSLMVWFFLPLNHYGSFLNTDFSFLWVLFISSLSIYSLFLSGLSSNSFYAFLGSLRSIAQMLSYEISFIFLILPIFFISGSFNFFQIVLIQEYFGFSNSVWLLPNAVLVFICLLAETNRAPFDLPEAEAELVAGYNVEYSSIPFAYFFLGEYLNILSMSLLFILLFFSGWSLNYPFFLISVLESLFLFFKVFIILFLIIWVRATMPRIRYDSLMFFCWKYSLTFSIAYFFIFLFFYSFLVFIHFSL